MGFADLHIHSVASDGTMTAEEIVRAARKNGASLISVCDHNVTAGTLAAEPLARAAGIRYIRGAEIDALWRGKDVHILCYGADFENPTLSRVLRGARRLLDNMSDDLLLRMLPDYPCLSLEEYNARPHDPKLGGWKLLQYLTAKGVTARLRDGFAFYDRYGVTYASAGFDGIEPVVRAIHAAGGRAVLAHPGVTFFSERLSEIEKAVLDAMECGIDGIECDYPTHASGLARRLREICDARGYLVTAGSDCHGAFGGRPIASTHTPEERVRI